MSKFILTDSFEGKAIYSAKLFSAELTTWVNNLSRDVEVAVRVRLGDTGGLLTNSAANLKIGLGITSGGQLWEGTLEPARAKSQIADLRTTLCSMNSIPVKDGDTLHVYCLSDNAGDIDFSTSALLYSDSRHHPRRSSPGPRISWRIQVRGATAPSRRSSRGSSLPIRSPSEMSRFPFRNRPPVRV